MFDFFKNTFLNRGRYKTHSEAVIISCFYNPQNNPYRLLAFQKWYHSIKHLNHRIIECMIGDAKAQLPDSEYITRVQTESLLWHKETLLNKLVDELPEQFKYIFWVDADVLFTNLNWLVDAVELMSDSYERPAGGNKFTTNGGPCRILQPFEFCVHLNRNKLKPDFNLDDYRDTVNIPERRQPTLWRSFCANHISGTSGDNNYDRHGHVGFAWGARREVLEECPLYDKALIGGSDHIMAHAAAGQIPHNCISKSFTENLDEVLEWSKFFYEATEGQIGYVSGDLYHIWHGDIADRKYLQRIRDYTKETKNLSERDHNGLYVRRDRNAYMKRYYRQREVTDVYYDDFDDFDAGFYEDMGYMIGDILNLFGRPTYDDDVDVPDVQPAPDQFVPDVQPAPDQFVPDVQPAPDQFVSPEIQGAPPAEVVFSQPEVSQHVEVPQEVFSTEIGTGNIVAESTDSGNFS